MDETTAGTITLTTVPSGQKKLFVVMPFGRRRASPEHGVEWIDFDAVYAQIIRPAAEKAGWVVSRIDEVVHPGSIPHQYLQEIYSADLVLADVSVPNANVFYELGIRHAISTGPRTYFRCYRDLTLTRVVVLVSRS